MNLFFTIIVLINLIFCSAISHVKPIVLDFTNTSTPRDINSDIALKVLLNANKFALQTWFPLKYGIDSGKYIDFCGTAELNIRLPAMEAFGLAVSIKTKSYDEKIVEKSLSEAIKTVQRLVSSVAYRHKANHANGWGDAWESALWAYWAGYAAWLTWEHYDAHDQEYIEKMIIHESDRFINYTVPYYRNREGKIITPGDTKAEENSWNSLIIQLATTMMPSHPHWKLWMKKNIELLVSSFSCPNDLHNATVVNGKEVKDWLNGSNVDNDGLLVNHNRIHPDYIVNFHQNLGAPLIYTMAGMETPLAAYWNDELMYSVLINHQFKSPPYQKPGGTIYVRDASGHATPDIYYPQGNDWGIGRRHHFAVFDTQISLLTPYGSKYHSEEWSYVHIEATYKMQQRFRDGRTYVHPNEDTYKGREEWMTSQAGYNYITRWFVYNFKDKIKITNKNYS